VVRRTDDDGNDGLTPAGREELRNVRNEFEATTAAELHRKRCCKRDDLDRDDVRRVLQDVLRAMSEPVTRGREHRRVGTGLVAVGSAGVGTMSGQLHSPWQIGLFAAMIVVGLVGAVLAYRPGGEPPATPGG
jgi:hypothetical protein